MPASQLKGGRHRIDPREIRCAVLEQAHLAHQTGEPVGVAAVTVGREKRLKAADQHSELLRRHGHHPQRLRTVFTTLFRRFPTLQLSTTIEDCRSTVTS
jgi:hypothetical protein